MKKNKSVTFQLADPYEARLFKSAQDEHNFSGLMKRLYAKHIEQQSQAPRAPQPIQAQRTSGGGIRIDVRSQGASPAANSNMVKQ